MSENDTEDAALGSSLTLVAKDGAWKQALGLAEQELRRALTFGFDEGELRSQKADMGARLPKLFSERCLICTRPVSDSVNCRTW